MCKKQLKSNEEHFIIHDASGIEDRLHEFNLTHDKVMVFDSLCYHKLLDLVCGKCGDVLSMGFFEAHDKKFHEECFVCGECGRALHDMDETDVVVDLKKKILCSACCPSK